MHIEKQFFIGYKETELQHHCKNRFEGMNNNPFLLVALSILVHGPTYSTVHASTTNRSIPLHKLRHFATPKSLKTLFERSSPGWFRSWFCSILMFQILSF